MPDPRTQTDFTDKLRLQCERVLYLHGHREPAADLSQLSSYALQLRCDCDRYGDGDFLNRFETEVADLLGFEAALFFPSGVMAQQAALRIHSERARNPHVAIPPYSHLEQNEYRGYRFLHGLNVSSLGDPLRPLLACDLDLLPEPLAAALVELPVRWQGGSLPDWDQLRDLKKAAAMRAIPLHLDGARIWECEPHYGRPLQEICAGFASVYVSFYKTLGAIAGAMLAGDGEFIEQARIWRRRQGGTLHQIFPLALSAHRALALRHSQIPAYVSKAAELAPALNALEGVTVRPVSPPTNLMHVCLRASIDELSQARDQIAREESVWMTSRFRATDVPGWSYMELAVGDVLESMDKEFVCWLTAKLLRHAH